METFFCGISIMIEINLKKDNDSLIICCRLFIAIIAYSIVSQRKFVLL